MTVHFTTGRPDWLQPASQPHPPTANHDFYLHLLLCSAFVISNLFTLQYFRQLISNSCMNCSASDGGTQSRFRFQTLTRTLIKLESCQGISRSRHQHACYHGFSLHLARPQMQGCASLLPAVFRLFITYSLNKHTALHHC